MIAIGIAHAAWDSMARVRALKRLTEQLDTAHLHILDSREREHARVWAMRLWKWAGEIDVDRVVLLNDDVEVCPRFATTIQAMHDACPYQMHSLHTALPQARELALEGHHWVKCYWYTGPGVSGTPAHFRDLYAYAQGHPEIWEKHNEDGMAIHWAWHRQLPFWNAIPAVIRHDTEIPSTLGYDNHPLRGSSVPWTDFQGDLTAPDSWAHPADPPLVENPWLPFAALDNARKVMRGVVPRPSLTCNFCGKEPPSVTAQETGVAIGKRCLAQFMGLAISRLP